MAYVLPLAAGLSACVTAFAALSAAYLTPLPFPEPQRLVEIWSSTSPRAASRSDLLPRERLDGVLNLLPSSLSAAAGYTTVTATLEIGDASFRTPAAIVTPAFFDVLERRPMLGSYDANPNTRAAVIGENVWRATFAGAHDVIGRSIRFGGQTYVIGAVNARGAGYPSGADLWIPDHAWAESAAPHAWIGVGRLRAGSGIAVLLHELQARAHAELRQDSARFDGMGMTAVPLDKVAAVGVGRAVPLTASAIALVYLAVLLNLAHLLLVRVLARERDTAVRTALGAGPWQLIRPVIAETALISALALGAGILLASWGILLLPRLDPALAVAALDWRVLAFAAVLGCVTMTAPVLASLSSMKLDSGALRPVALRRTHRQRVVRGILVAAQVAVAVALLAIVGALMQAVDTIRDLDVGYDAAQLVLVRPEWSNERWTDAAQREELEPVLRRMLMIPGVESGAVWRTRAVAWPPPPPEKQLSLEGSSVPIAQRQAIWNYDEVTPSLFRTLGLELVEGRGFDERDARGALPVAIVTESAARAWWPGESPLGRRIRLGDDAGPEPWLTIVGVARDIEPIIPLARAVAATGRPARRVFRPLAQAPDEAAPQWASRQCFYCSKGTLGIRAAGDARLLAERVRREIVRIAPDLPASVVITALDEQMDAYGPAQFARSSRLLGAFGTVALLIALLGIGVVVSDTVTRRRHELGVRITLGAGAGRIVGTVIRDSLVTCFVGTCVGIGMLVTAEPLIRRWVFLGGNATLLPGTGTLDWFVIVPTSVALLAVSALCAAAVGYQATRIDPMTVLRQD